MFSSPLLAVDRTWLPPRLREQVGRWLGGPPRGPVQRRWKAAIYQLDRLGDFVLALGAIRLLIAEWGEENCLLVISNAAGKLAALEFPRVARIELPVNAPSLTRDLVPAWWRHRPAFRGVFCEHVVCLSHHRDLYKTMALSWIATGRSSMLERTTYPETWTDPLCLELEAHRKLVGIVLGRNVSAAEIVPRLQGVDPRAETGLLVCPFASEPVRQMPRKVLLEALALWRARSRAPITLNGLPGDAGILSQLAAEIEQRGLGPLSVAVTGSFEAFLRLMAGAGAVLAVESAPSHLATAMDKPAAIVTGGGTFGLCGPWRLSARQVSLHHHVSCYGCGWRCSQPEVYCLTGVSPGAIAAALPAL